MYRQIRQKRCSGSIHYKQSHFQHDQVRVDPQPDHQPPDASQLLVTVAVHGGIVFTVFIHFNRLRHIRNTYIHIFMTKGCLFVGYILSTGARFGSKGCRRCDDYLHKVLHRLLLCGLCTYVCSEATGEPGRVPCSRATATRSALGGRRSAHQFTNNSKLPSFKKCHSDWWGCWLNRLAIRRPCG